MVGVQTLSWRRRHIQRRGAAALQGGGSRGWVRERKAGHPRQDEGGQAGGEALKRQRALPNLLRLLVLRLVDAAGGRDEWVG